jgi:hypothetical protein
MASTSGSGPKDPAGDKRANYDYAGGAVDRPELVDDLDGLVDGEVRFDDYTKQLYATDASAYEGRSRFCHAAVAPVLPASR